MLEVVFELDEKDTIVSINEANIFLESGCPEL